MKIRKLLSRLTGLVGAAVLALTLGGCNNTSSDNNDGTGELVIGLTDAQGDFVTYTVDVTSLSLTKADGSVVTTLAEPVTVDFAQYTDMTEFLTAATVPRGAYTAATLRLDFTNADIQVEDADGSAVPVTGIQNADGNTLSTLEVSVKLQGRNALVIAPGVPAHLTLDFDLNASNSVDFSIGAPLVTVEPFLLANLNPVAPKPHRLRGMLESVDVAGDRFDVVLRPFRHAISQAAGNGRFGSLSVTTTPDTAFEVDGLGYTGDAGLDALSALGSLSAVVVIGDLRFNPRRFEAREVYAGSSVPGGDKDVVTGNVIARDASSLTVLGARLQRAGGSVVFHDQVTIALSDAAKIRRVGGDDGLTGDDIAVGQRVTVFGALDETAEQPSMQADFVRMGMSQLRGNVETPSPLSVTVQSIDLRRVELFDLISSGFTVNTGSLDLSGLQAGDAVQVRGVFTATGFDAVSVIDVTDKRARLGVLWQPAASDALSAIDAEGITLNLDAATAVLRRGGVVDTPSAARLEPAAAGTGSFLIKQQGVITLHTRFADFVDDLSGRLDGTVTVRGLRATGRYDDATATLTTPHVAIHLQ